MKPLTDKQKQIVIEMAENDMSIVGVGRAIGISPSSVKGQIVNIAMKTGLDPRCFYDLVELIDIVREEQV